MRTAFYFIAAGLLLLTTSINSRPVLAQPDDVPAEAQPQGPTDFAALDRFIREYTDEVEGGNGRWAFQVGGVAVMVMADRAADRMRIMTPVAREADFDDGEYRKLLESNFDRALDARYALNGGVLWSAFIHPMSSLSHDQFDDGLAQVIRLSSTFGTTYTSSDMIFAPREGQPQEPSDPGQTPTEPKGTPTPPGRGAPPAPRT